MTVITKGSGGIIKLSGTGGNVRISLKSSGTFDPLSLGNLRAWYKADALGLSNGATVTSWIDNSGTGNNMSSYSGTPIYNASDAQFGGMPSVSFDGSSYLYKNNPISLPVDGASFSAYVVGYGSGTAPHQMFGWGTNAGAVGVRVSFVSDVGYYVMEFCNMAAAGFGATMSTPVILSYSYTNGSNVGSFPLYIDNVASPLSAFNDGPLNIFGPSIDITMGTMPGFLGYSNLTNGKLAEALIYDTVHTNTQRVQVTQYLAAKYSITI